jgi:hypothetical protein
MPRWNGFLWRVRDHEAAHRPWPVSPAGHGVGAGAVGAGSGQRSRGLRPSRFWRGQLQGSEHASPCRGSWWRPPWCWTIRRAAGSIQAHLRARLQSFGFLWPDRIDGAGHPIMPPRDHPLGISVGEVTPGLPPVKVTVANLGCASCHAGPVYSSDGSPQPATAWLGSPNTSLDLEAYTRAVTTALKRQTKRYARCCGRSRPCFPTPMPGRRPACAGPSCHWPVTGWPPSPTAPVPCPSSTAHPASPTAWRR